MKWYALCAMGIMLVAAGSAFSDSLWTPQSRPLTADVKAHQVGDLVTILIVETSFTSQKATTDYSKKLDHNNAAGVGPLVNALPPVAISSDQKSSASGTTTSASTFTSKICAKVTKVLPNGLLELEGIHTIETVNEKQEIKLTGVVRPEDIASDDTVLSTFLADAQIKYSGKGPISDRQKEGVLSWLVKFLF